MSSSAEQVLLDSAIVMGQNITLFDRYGQTFTTQLEVVNYMLNYVVTEGIIYGSQVGACFILLVVLLLVSKAEKRRSPVFIFNTLSLLFNLIHAVLQCCYYTSTWLSAYSFLSYDFSFVTPAARRSTVATVIFVALTTICIEISLVLQVRVVSVTLNSWQKLGVLIASTFVALVAVGFRIARSIVTLECNSNDFCNKFTWMDKAKDIALTLSICFFSMIFCAKLGWSLRERRKLGMRQFGSMQIIFIGGLQTMIIPAIFSILQFVSTHRLPQIGSNVLTVTAISLPLTSLWASSSAASPSKAARGPDAHRKFLVDSSTDDSTRKASIGSSFPIRNTGIDRLGVLNSVSTAGGTPREGEADHWGKWSPGSKIGVGVRDVDRDLEMQELKERD